MLAARAADPAAVALWNCPGTATWPLTFSLPQEHTITSTIGAGLVVFERRYVVKGGLPVFSHGSVAAQPLLPVEGEVFRLRKLLPQTGDYDFNVHVMDFLPGGSRLCAAGSDCCWSCTGRASSACLRTWDEVRLLLATARVARAACILPACAPRTQQENTSTSRRCTTTSMDCCCWRGRASTAWAMPGSPSRQATSSGVSSGHLARSTFS